MNGDANGKPLKQTSSLVKGRMQVSLLDDTVVAFDVEQRSKGHELYAKVNKHLNLDEPEFFGLLFQDEHENQTWLDHMKPISKQVKDPTKITFKFRVRFYTPDPNSLQEYTRYLFTLQVRRDLLDGRLYCVEDTGALLASYIVQGELGDYDPLNHKEGYLAGFQFVPNQTKDIEEKIVSYHRSHRGESPAESDHNMLEIARKIEMYGITLYPAQDSDGVKLNLAVYHSGILVFQDRNRVINNFSWANIRKVTFKKKRFLIKLHKGTNEENDTLLFNLCSRAGAKSFWKVCINHHVFFRYNKAPRLKKKSSFKRGSRYRYSGRTKKEISEEASNKFQASSVDPGSDRGHARLSGTYNFPETPSSHAVSSSASFNRQVSEDQGSYSIGGEAYSPEPIRHEITTPLPTYQSTIEPSPPTQHTVITMQHQETLDTDSCHGEAGLVPPSYEDVVNTTTIENDAGDSDKYSVHEVEQETEMESTPPITSSIDYQVETDLPEADLPQASSSEPPTPPSTNGFSLTNGHAEGDDLSLDATINITSTDEGGLGDEMESMFNKLTSEYGSKNTSWKYDLSPLSSPSANRNTSFDHEDSKIEADKHHSTLAPEADADSEVQLREQVKALYLQNCPTTHSYDSDSDASAISVDDEGSAFEDDLSYASSATSSVSSIHKNRDYLSELRLKYRSNGKIYHIAKEILQTERTYVKDLEVLTVSFRDVVENDNVLPARLLKFLYENIDPLYDFHCSLLAELEERISLWDSSSTTEASRDNIQKIGDIMHRNMRQIKMYTSCIKKHCDIIIELEKYANKSPDFEKAYKEFEMSKVCYLSVNSFLMKPTQRILYYRSMLNKLTNEYGKGSADAIDSKVAYEEIVEACKIIEPSISKLENMHKLVELERDLVAITDLLHPKRLFIREGCLHKICRKGPQPRMFFLLSDILLYTSQGVTATNQFRARAQIPLRSIRVEEGGVELHGLYAFTIVGPGTKSFIVAASSPDEKQKWMEDIRRAINNAIKMGMCVNCQSNKSEFILYVGQDNSHMCHKCQSEIEQLGNMAPEERLQFWQSRFPPPPNIKRPSLDADSDDEGSYTVNDMYNSLDRRHAHSRTISTRRVCWHRNTSISMKEYTLSIQNSISGELFRRYKNTSKWQKLWVVFTNFCLYFFKTGDEDAPLANLPLLGYTISRPTEAETHEEFAFKLQFKTHQYLFKTDNEYTYERWYEVLSTATKASNTLSSRSRRKLPSIS
eukprot:TCONS_00053826-protein